MDFPQFIPTQVMYKNQLQEYTQKLAKPHPIYQTVNEGFPHAPKFRSTVLVDGSKYESGSTHLTKIQAEQAVAKIAYECIQKTIDSKDFSLIYRELLLCKSILYEFAVKKNMNRPIYNTRYAEGPSSVYISHMVLGGRTYKGEVAGSKKMAEQLAARAAIESLLETDAGTLSQIIVSKSNCHPGVQTRKDTGPVEKMLPKCSGNLQGQKASIERTVVCFKTDGTVGNPGSRPKREAETNNWGRNKMRRFGN
ncbi:double-stranded RNA-binding protein 4-like [Lycium ferocissimum]|uniref:double-stranded RNA-binding protein 4-like n=1 Tax=Lycium ferocissimum TaxID=112874 RepID=UPI0028168122|nr:double-stranded RNA-binding protein 4-like [Lycium ferocissimum]